MTFRDAKKLHSGDQVTLKSTGETGEVLSAELNEESRIVLVEALFHESGYMKGVPHWDVR